MSRFFISYRRADSQGSAGRLYDSLERQFGSDQVFMDRQGFTAGELWSEKLFAEIGGCDVLIVVIGPQWLQAADQTGRRLDDPEDVVRREIELAVGRNKVLVPVLVDGGVLPDASALPETVAPLVDHQAVTVSAATWNDDVKRLAKSLDEVTKNKYRRGFWRSDVVDGSLYVGMETLDFKQAIETSIRDGEVLDPMYYYVTPTSFQNWMNLTKEPGYSSYHEAVAFYEARAPEIAGKVLEQVESTHLDFVSLGPGDGRKDRILLRAFFEAVSPGLSAVWYYPYDINPSMITQSLREVAQDAGIARNRLRVKAVVSSFRVLTRFVPLYRDYQPGPNLLCLLGNTLGNMPLDRVFLEKLHNDAMARGDLLLLEVKKRVDFADRADKVRLADELRNKFTIGPLELLGVPYEPERLYRQVEEGRSQIAGCQSLCSYYRGLRYDNEEFERVRLSYIHEYEVGPLERALREVGFDLVHDWPDERSVIVLLLRKR